MKFKEFYEREIVKDPLRLITLIKIDYYKDQNERLKHEIQKLKWNLKYAKLEKL